MYLYTMKLYLELKNIAHGLVNYEDTKTKCRHLKKLTCKRYFAAGIY
jgi:hypothetical protein